MKTMRVIWGVAKADFLERMRRFSFIASCALAVFFTFWFVPRPSGFTALVIEPSTFRQGSNSSWVPMSAAMCGGMMLCLFGFAYILNAVGLDRRNGVLALLRTSPAKRADYLFGKLISNTLLLLCLLAAIIAGSFAIMEVRFPGQFLSPWDFFSPFLCIIPGLVFISAFALLMECAPVFRRRSGLSITLFLCLSTAIFMSAAMGLGPYRLASVFDFSGYLWMRDSIAAAARSVTGMGVTQISVFTNSHVGGTDLKVLTFHGLLPSASYLLDKLVLLAASVLLTLLASGLLPKTESMDLPKMTLPVSSGVKILSTSAVPTFPLGLLRAELRKLLAKQSVIWWFCIAGLWIACLFSPMDVVRNTLFVLISAFFIPVFSRMGCLEHQSGMTSILRTIPDAMIRQASACWRAGALISLSATFPVLIRSLFLEDSAGFLSALLFALLVPSAALFFGEWTASNRPFEILLLILCFLALNIPSLLITDGLSGFSDMRIAVTILLTAGMLALAYGKRYTEQKVHP